MKKLLDINDLSKKDIQEIWQAVNNLPAKNLSGNKQNGNIGWSFEGNGIRTRTTFVQAFQRLGLNYVELPNFLKTPESTQDLASYMDPFYSLYVIRDNNHARMVEFANASNRPVINAMTCDAHPCEVLTDAYYLESEYGPLQKLRILLWGPITNVLKSWHSLSELLELDITHYCPLNDHLDKPNLSFSDQITGQYDVVITDAWPGDFADPQYSLSLSTLAELGSPVLIPTPPVSVGKEVAFAPIEYANFAGYAQKQLLLPVQESIISHFLSQ